MSVAENKLDITVMEATESTSSLALEALERGASAGTVFVADHQSAGRGRRESGGERRQWFSPAGENLYFSVVARPDVPVDRSAAITLAVGVELSEYLRESTGVDVALKWPNDLYVGDRKLAGILTEGVTGPGGLEGVVIGVGLNVNVAGREFPDELQDKATSLFEETGRRFDRLSLALSAPKAVFRACRAFAADGLRSYSASLKRLDLLRDRRLEIVEDKQKRGGRGRGIGERGGLRVEFDDGEVREVVSGEITVSRW